MTHPITRGSLPSRNTGQIQFNLTRPDSASGDHDAFRGEVAAAGLPFVMGPETPPRTWAYKS